MVRVFLFRKKYAFLRNLLMILLSIIKQAKVPQPYQRIYDHIFDRITSIIGNKYCITR